MNNIIEYKGYYAKIEYNSYDKILFGKIEGIVDLITFESTDATTIEQEFRNAVDDYLEFCAEVGKDPDKSYKGTFNVRISPDLHKELAIRAFKISVRNTLICVLGADFLCYIENTTYGDNLQKVHNML